MLILGEAYAFGVVWSFVFQGISMMVLRFKDPRRASTRFPSISKLAAWKCLSAWA